MDQELDVTQPAAEAVESSITDAGFTTSTAEDTPPEVVEETEAEKNAKIVAANEQKAAARRARDDMSTRNLVSKLTAEKEAAEKLANRALDLAIGRQAPAKGDIAPARENYESYEDFLRADARYSAAADTKAALEQFKQEQQQARETETRQRSEHEVNQRFHERMQQAMKTIPDFEETISNHVTPVAPIVLEAIKRMENGPNVAYHLGKNPALVARLNTADPMSALLLVGEISASLKPAAKISDAPPPGKPAGNTVVASSLGDPPDDPGEYRKWAAKADKMR